MAFTSRIGNTIRRTLVAPSSPLLQTVRCMSSSKLFVAGLPYAIDEPALRNEFSKYGDVLEARVIMDRESGRSRGFGFVTYTSSEEASAAITAMDGTELQGRPIKVNHANDRAGGYSSGGYAGNGGYGGAGGSSGYGSNYNNASGGGYAGNGGYSNEAASGGYASKFNSASGGGGGGGSYGTTGNPGGNAGGYNSPNTYGAVNYNSGPSSGGSFGEFGGGFGNGGFGAAAAGPNNGNNFAGNATSGSYNGHSSTGGFSGGGSTGYGANKPQYNGQDDLLGDSFFDDKEAAENR
ncbi:unnamed protein product [Urochloa humidicola]